MRVWCLRSRRSRLAALALVPLTVIGGPPAAPRELSVSGARDAAVVRIPEGDPPPDGWPAVFFYHGMGGRPTVAPLASQPAASNYVLVGMPYAEPEPVGRTRSEYEAWLARERARLLETRRAVGRLAPLATNAMLVGGVSMGGWTAAALYDRHPADHAGLVVLLAGRRSDDPRPPYRAPFAGRPVYLGAGETDPNLAAARRSATFYRSLGALVTFEVFERVGHDVPAGASRLDAWLWVQAMRRLDRTHAQPTLDGWWTNALAALRNEPNPAHRAMHLEAIRDDPRLVLCESGAVADLNRIAAELAREPAVRDRWNAERELEHWLAAEWSAVTLDALRAVRDGLTSLIERHPSTPAARFAAVERDALNRVLAQSRQVVLSIPSAPTSPPPLRAPAWPLHDRRVPPLRRR